MLHVVTEIFKNQVQFDFIGYNMTTPCTSDAVLGLILNILKGR